MKPVKRFKFEYKLNKRKIIKNDIAGIINAKVKFLSGINIISYLTENANQVQKNETNTSNEIIIILLKNLLILKIASII